MADLVIRGMEMPEYCYECPCHNGESGYCQAYKSGYLNSIERPAKCPLVPLTEGHGRLIDAEELRKAMYHEAFETDSHMQKWESGCWIRYRMFERNLETVSTIVPADVADNYVGSKSEEGETDDSKL